MFLYGGGDECALLRGALVVILSTVLGRKETSIFLYERCCLVAVVLFLE